MYTNEHWLRQYIPRWAFLSISKFYVDIVFERDQHIRVDERFSDQVNKSIPHPRKDHDQYNGWEM